MDLRTLRYFLAVARHGSVAAAARVLHVAQPALSRQITGLEEELATSLFVRMPRGVVLTRAGEELMTRASEIVASAHRLKDQVALAAQGRVGSLRIGVMPGYSWLPQLGASLQKLSELAPNTRLVIEPGMSIALLEGLKKHELDAAIVAWRSPLDGTLTALPVFRDRMVVAMPKTMALARSRQPRLADFASEHFIMFARERSPMHFDVLARAFAQAGLSPAATGVTASDVSTMVGLVANGLGCAVVPESYRSHVPREVVMRAAEGLDAFVELELVWRTGSTDPLLQRFITIWSELGQESDQSPSAPRRKGSERSKASRSGQDRSALS